MKTESQHNLFSWPELMWDMWCVASGLGIWPRFIEPHLLCSSKIPIYIPHLPSCFIGLRIAFFSDIHINKHISDHFLSRIQEKITDFKPHLILFGGDALCYGSLSDEDSSRLMRFFSSLKAPLGIFASLGNHDYSQYTTEARDGQPMVYNSHPGSITWGLKKLFGVATPEAFPRTSPIEMNQKLLDMYRASNVHVLHNQCVQLSHGLHKINLLGLGDLTAGHFDPETAFANWEQHSLGIILGHNPNTLPTLQYYPGNLLLFGHTHGGQVNLPLFSKRLVYLIDQKLKSGLLPLEPWKYAYITRGIGSCYPFRWFSPPELVFCTLMKSTHVPVEAKSYFQKKERAHNIQWAASRISSDDTV